MDAMGIAAYITAAIISNPNYKPGSGKEEVKLFNTVLKEVTRSLGAGEKAERKAVSAGAESLSVRDMRVRRSPLGAEESI